MKISSTASTLLFSCFAFKPAAAEDLCPKPEGRSQPVDRALNVFDGDVEGAVGLEKVGKASTATLMGRPLEGFLSTTVPFDDQKSTILSIAAGSPARYGDNIELTGKTEEEVRSYLISQVDAGRMEEDAAEAVAVGLDVKALYAAAAATNDVGPVEAVYNTEDFGDEGNMERLQRSKSLNFYNRCPTKAIGIVNCDRYVNLEDNCDKYDGDDDDEVMPDDWLETCRDDNNRAKRYTGIWGYATGDREYAIQCHGYGVAIIDVTSYAYRVQLIRMEGGDRLRDVVTWEDPSDGKTYAYVGGELTSETYATDPTSLWVIDLSYLSGDEPHRINSRPIPPEGRTQISGYNGQVHTINAQRGLLFLNDFGPKGCQVLDLTTNPMEPKKLFEVGNSCHDSYVRENIKGRDILFVSDGPTCPEIMYDITDVDANTDSKPPEIGRTDKISDMFDHSSWLSEDNRYLFVFDERSNPGEGIVVYDVENLENPKEITRFRTSLAATEERTVPHNGQIRGKYLYVAYYDAGLRVFDISNPKLPVEVGKVETSRNPDGYGAPEREFWPLGIDMGAWNVYLGLPSGKILVNDCYNGLFVVRANKPYSNPLSPTLTGQRRIGDWIELKWNAVANARGYSVQKKRRRRSKWKTIAEHLVFDGIFEPSFDTSHGRNYGAFFRIMAYNAEGIAYSNQIKVKPA